MEGCKSYRQGLVNTDCQYGASLYWTQTICATSRYPEYHADMIAAHSIPKIIEQHTEDAASLWLIRDNAVRASSFRLSEFIRFDERVEAHIDGLRIAEINGWVASLNELEDGGAGEFFVAGVLAVEGGDSGRLGQVIERAYARAAKTASESYHRAYDPWRGLVSAVAWVNRAHAAGVIEWLLDTPRPRTRWLGVAACGARRSVRQYGLKAVLADREPVVRARAARTIGELGKTDCRSELNAMLDDPEDDCRFWAAWSAARLGTTEGLRALTEFARSPGAHCDRALDLLLRLLSTEHANAFLRVLAREHGRRRTLIHAAAVVGDALYIPWLATQARDPSTARISGDAFAMITGADLAALGLTLPLPAGLPGRTE